jgi:4-hydroxy-tetrahydrodipicolinate synthase
MAQQPLFAFCCMITPFDTEGRLDEAAIELLAERIVDAGLGLALGTASPGEGHSLTPSETERLYAAGKRVAAGRVPVVAMGCEQRSAAEFVPFIRIAEQVGVDAVQLYQMELMHASKPGVAELERYFRTLLEGMTIPARLSTHQQNGYTTPIETIDRLLTDYPHIDAIHCTTDIDYMRRLVDVVDGRALILLGGAQHLLPGLSFGANGYLDSTGALLAPRLNASVIEHYKAGRLDEMAEAYHQITRLSGISRVQSPQSGTGSVRVAKAAMRVLGLPGWTLRPPYLSLDEKAHHETAEYLKAMKIPELESLLAMA